MTISNTKSAIPHDFFKAHEGDVKHTLVVGPRRAGMTIHSSYLSGKTYEYVQNILRIARKGNDGSIIEAKPEPYYRRLAKNKY